MARSAPAAVAALLLSSCVLFFPQVEELSPPPSVGLEPPDATQPAAGICQGVFDSPVFTLTLALDTPQPRCGLVTANQQLRVVNETSETVTVTFNGADFVLQPGADHTFAPTFGAIWQAGVHILSTSAYAGGAAIWLVDH